MELYHHVGAGSSNAISGGVSDTNAGFDSGTNAHGRFIAAYDADVRSDGYSGNDAGAVTQDYASFNAKPDAHSIAAGNTYAGHVAHANAEGVTYAQPIAITHANAGRGDAIASEQGGGVSIG